MQKIKIPELEELIGSYNPKNRTWTDEEELILRTYFHRVDTYALAKFLNRTPAAVEIKALRLRL